MKKIILLLIFITNCLYGIAQMNWVKQWDHRYGGMGGDYVMTFEKTIDGGYILAGRSGSDSSGNKMTNLYGNGPFDYWVIKVNHLGVLQWEKNYNGSDNEWLWSLNKTNDGGYIIGGWSDSPIGGDKSEASRGGTDYWILKLDANGNKIWDKTFGGSDDDELNYVFQTDDGGYLLGGESHSGISGDKTEAKFGISDYWIVKTDSAGNKEWDKVYGGPGYETYKISIQTPDHGFIHGGQSNGAAGGNKTDPSNGGVDYWLVKTDSIGNIQWDSSYGGLGDDNFQDMIMIPGGGFMLGGWSTSGVGGDKTQPSNGQYDFWILKITSAGAIVWDRDYGGTGIEDEFNCIVRTGDGGYLIGATSYSPIAADKTEANLGVEQPWVIKIDSAGNKLWDKTIFTNGHLEAGLIKESSEGDCYVVVSSENSLMGGDKSEDAWGGFSSDYWIVKYCEVASTGIDENSLRDDELIVFPNPFVNEIKITLSADNTNSPATASLFDALGKQVLTKEFKSSVTLNTTEVASGNYTLEVTVKGKVSKKKIVK